MRGYDSSKTERPAPKVRPTENKEKKSRKRRQSDGADEVPTKKVPFVDDESLFGENIDFEYPASSSSVYAARGWGGLRYEMDGDARRLA